MGHPAGLIGLLHLGRIHDETPELRAFLAEGGIASELVPLPALADWGATDSGATDGDSIDWGRFDRVSVRDCRDSHRHPDFLARIRALAAHLEVLKVPLANPLAVIEAGHAKSHYLPQLERQGVALIPSRWLPRGWRGSLTGLLEACGWREAVLKPAIGAKSWQTYRVRRQGPGLAITAADGSSPAAALDAVDADAWLAGLALDGEVCVQRFLPGICRAGSSAPCSWAESSPTPWPRAWRRGLDRPRRVRRPQPAAAGECGGTVLGCCGGGAAAAALRGVALCPH